MCLHAIRDTYVEPRAYYGIGYKVMLRCLGSYLFLHQGRGDEVLSGQWIHEHDHRYGSWEFIDSLSSYYPTGFHIYDRYEDAAKAAELFGPHRPPVLLVNYTGVVAEGSEYDAKVIVAKDMKILAELE